MTPFWNRVDAEPVINLTAQRYAAEKGGLVEVLFDYQFRVRLDSGNTRIFITPTPTEDMTQQELRDGQLVDVGLAFEYITKYVARGADGTLKMSFDTDTDESLIPEDVVEFDMRWRFLKALGQPYAEEKDEAEQYKNWALGARQGSQPVQLSPRARRPYLRNPNIPETGIGQP